MCIRRLGLVLSLPPPTHSWTADDVDRHHRCPAAATDSPAVDSVTAIWPRLNEYEQWYSRRTRGGSTLGQGGTCPPRFTCCPQIQKLADRSVAISEAPKMLQNKNFPRLCPGSRWGSIQRSPRSPNWWEGLIAPAKNPTPTLGPSGLVSTGHRV